MTAQTATVVAISRQKGSGGGRIGQAIAEKRGMRYIDGAMLRDASEYLLEHDPNLEKVGERIDTWWSTMAGALAMGGLGGLGMVPVDTVRESEVATVERRIIEELALQHPAVIIGRGAGHVLKGKPGVLTVFFHAPETFRVARIAKRTETAEAKARDAVRESDRHRGSFLRTLTGTDWTDARQYDLSIDTASVGLEAATELVMNAMVPATAR
jgi:cytidylate kinase